MRRDMCCSPRRSQAQRVGLTAHFAADNGVVHEIEFLQAQIPVLLANAVPLDDAAGP